MKASELVEALSSLIEQHGDLEIATRTHYLHYDPIHSIEVETSRVNEHNKYFKVSTDRPDEGERRRSRWEEHDKWFGKENLHEQKIS